MTQTQQPEALRLAEILEQYALSPLREVAAELRRQHARINELEAQLSAIGAGGVEPLRKPAATASCDDTMHAVLSCPHTITHESITLRFNPKQDGYNALAQLHNRLTDYDAAVKAREMELLAVIEDLERLIPLINRWGTP